MLSSSTSTLISPTEASASSDDLDTTDQANWVSEGVAHNLRSASSGRDVVLQDATGNLRLAGSFRRRTDGMSWSMTTGAGKKSDAWTTRSNSAYAAA